MDIFCIIPRVSGYLQVPSHGGARPLQGSIIYDKKSWKLNFGNLCKIAIGFILYESNAKCPIRTDAVISERPR